MHPLDGSLHRGVSYRGDLLHSLSAERSGTVTISDRVAILLGLILQKRLEIVRRVEQRVQAGEPSMQKHRDLMRLHDEARVYTAELAGIIGEDEAEQQWAVLGRIAYGLEGNGVSSTLLDIHLFH